MVDEPNDSTILVHPKHAVVAQEASFLQVVIDGKVWIPIYNNSKQNVKIQTGTLLASYEVVDDQVEASNKMNNQISQAMGPDNRIKGNLSREEKLQLLMRRKD